MPHTTLVSTEELARHQQWRLFDCRHDLMKPDFGKQQYAEAHIPGALFAQLDHDLSASPDGTNGRHPLPAGDAFVAWLGRVGLSADDQVVVYDAGPGSTAARLWWMLRWVGHDAVAVLDGGLAKWLAEARPVTRDVPTFAGTVHPGRARPGMHVAAREVESTLGADGVMLLDARAPVRFLGESEPIDPVAGRIPGAANRFITANVADGRFKPAQALRAEFGTLLGGADARSVVHYCGSGVAACHNLLAMEIAGLAGSRLYAGSWSEWIADERRPRAQGHPV